MCDKLHCKYACGCDDCEQGEHCHGDCEVEPYTDSFLCQGCKESKDYQLEVAYQYNINRGSI